MGGGYLRALAIVAVAQEFGLEPPCSERYGHFHVCHRYNLSRPRSLSHPAFPEVWEGFRTGIEAFSYRKWRE